MVETEWIESSCVLCVILRSYADLLFYTVTVSCPVSLSAVSDLVSVLWPLWEVEKKKKKAADVMNDLPYNHSSTLGT